MQSVLALPPSRERRIWTILDELPSLHKLPVILDYLSEARKFGGATLIGIQNFSQLEANYGAQEARAIWDLVIPPCISVRPVAVWRSGYKKNWAKPVY